MNASEVLEREFLPLRAKLLEMAAALDRIERADGLVHDDPRLTLVRSGLETLLRPDHDRAEQIQLLFSRPYNENWQKGT